MGRTLRVDESRPRISGATAGRSWNPEIRRVRILGQMLRRLVVFLALAATLPMYAASSGRVTTSARHLVRVGAFDSPVYLTAPRTERGVLYVVEQGGRIVRVAGGKRTTFLDITPQVRSGGEQGLLGLAFHPRYAKNGLFYIDYTTENGNTVIAEYRARKGNKPLRTR